MTWTTAAVGVTCGSCGRRIAVGETIALVTAQRKVRCPACVPVVASAVAPEDLDVDLDAPARPREPGDDDA